MQNSTMWNMKPVKFGTWNTDHCKHVNYQREQYQFGTWRTVQIWYKRTEQIWNKENSTNLEQGEQYKFRTRRTVQSWNKENSTKLEHVEQYKIGACRTVQIWSMQNSKI